MASNQFILENAHTMGKLRYAFIPFEAMGFDERYQRIHGDKAFYEMVCHWDDELCDVIKVSYRSEEDKFYVVDGKRRCAAAQENGLKGLPAQILTDKQLQREAEIFYKQDQRKKKLTPLEAFKGALVAQEPSALLLEQIANEYGLIIPEQEDQPMLRYNDCFLGGITTAWSLCKQNKVTRLRWIFDTLQAYPEWRNYMGTAACLRTFRDYHAAYFPLKALRKSGPSLGEKYAPALHEFLSSHHPWDLINTVNAFSKCDRDLYTALFNAMHDYKFDK